MSPASLTRRGALAAGIWAGLSGFAPSAEKPAPLVYLLPAPKEAVALAPFVLAESLGFYRDAGLDVGFERRAGGLEVGKALARGEGDLGGASGDTAVVLRDQGLPIKGVALLGRRSFLTIMTRRDAAVSLTDLTGCTFGVPSFADVSYYGLEHLIKSSGVAAEAVAVRAAAPEALWTALGAGEFDGVVGTVDWGVRAERSGTALDYLPLDAVFPGAMAQAVLASEHAIGSRPDQIRAFNAATLRAIRLILDRPDHAAAQHRIAVPASDLTMAETARIFTLFGKHVYGSARRLGHFQEAKLDSIADVYVQRGLISSRSPAVEYYQRDLIG